MSTTFPISRSKVGSDCTGSLSHCQGSAETRMPSSDEICLEILGRLWKKCCHHVTNHCIRHCCLLIADNKSSSPI